MDVDSNWYKMTLKIHTSENYEFKYSKYRMLNFLCMVISGFTLNLILKYTKASFNYSTMLRLF